MKYYCVYELVNLMGTIEYVGQTCKPKDRLYQHLKYKAIDRSGHGKFYGRADILMNIVKSNLTKKESLILEEKLQNEYGLTTDRKKSTPLSKRNTISVYQYSSNKLIGKFESQSEAARQLQLSTTRISLVLNGKQTHHKGYTFKAGEAGGN